MAQEQKKCKYQVSSQNYMEGGETGRVVGIDLLRIIMCFGVVLCHFWRPDDSNNIDIIINSIREDAVPVFTLLAFYFSAKIVESRDWNRIGIRVFRLLKPYIIWPIIMFVLYNGSSFILHRKLIYSMSDLGYQYLMGHTLISGVMYFNWDIIIITLICSAFVELFPKMWKNVYLLLFILSVVFVCGGYNYTLFSKFPYEICYPLGRLAELIPYAFLGIMFSHFDFEGIKELFVKHGISRLSYILLLFETLYICLIAPTINSIITHDDFGYGEPGQFILSICFFSLAIFFPHRLPKIVENIILQVARHTVGIYCVHFIVGKGLTKVFMYLHISIGSVGLCIIVFLMSLIVVYGISRLPWQWCKDITV